jgi:hypothetical protein
MYFKDEQHQMLYQNFLYLLEAEELDSAEYKVFCYLAAATKKRAIADYLSERGVDFKGLRQRALPWSTSEKALLQLGYQLFDGSSLFEDDELITDIFYSLDNNNVTVALLALKMRYQG